MSDVKEKEERKWKLIRELNDKMGLDSKTIGFIEIPIAELSTYGTCCGHDGNKAMAKTIPFLQSIGVESVYAIRPAVNEIAYMAARMSITNGRKLEDIVEKAGGSLRSEQSSINGIMFFESE